MTSRRSARLKAAKQKEKNKTQVSEPSSSASERATKPSKEHFDSTRSKRCLISDYRGLDSFFLFLSPRRSSLPTPALLEPVLDRKGKRRAAPEPSSDEESAGPSTKRARTTSYSSNLQKSRPGKVADTSKEVHFDDADDDDDEEKAKNRKRFPAAQLRWDTSNEDIRPRVPAAVAAYSERSAVSSELTKERSLAQALAGPSESTPPKAGVTEMGIYPTTRKYVAALLAEETHGRRSKSTDLVDFLFGSLFDIDGAADILKELLALSILSVEKATIPGKPKQPTKSLHEDACKEALSQAKEAVKSSKLSPADPYLWNWNVETQATETSVALFLNVVAITAHSASLRSGKVQKALPPGLRFVTLPDPHQPVPLSRQPGSQFFFDI
ncbi:hypothetical protein GGX14DRAFT_561652 [Mycena pura]|uniref:Uncharacterized protein n=1 Tax=Mycena pura TaxID=153505 RepID=A0AAD6YFJ1_9AGAR|nr:hypothetical protein GGX14DRAFT_561652 [Mycena pura]